MRVHRRPRAFEHPVQFHRNVDTLVTVVLNLRSKKIFLPLLALEALLIKLKPKQQLYPRCSSSMFVSNE